MDGTSIPLIATSLGVQLVFFAVAYQVAALLR